MIRHKNRWAIDLAEEHSLFAKIVMLPETVDVAISVDLVLAVFGRIPCNGAVKQVFGGVVCTGRLAS